MKLTEAQLRKVIVKEISNLIEAETAGEKAAGKAADATSLSAFNTAASKVMDAKGVAQMVVGAIKSTRLGGDLKTNSAKIKEALRMILNNYDEFTSESAEETPQK